MFGEGSLKHLHTFTEVARIYKIDSSTIRKKVIRGELRQGTEVEKFGGTWVITEQAMINHFGKRQFEYYLREGVVQEFNFSTKKVSVKQAQDDEENFFF